ncbi:aminopeptidase P family protein [Macrococcus brunensis]|uniref:Aminopeptidase P family protein n=1 Tax=Macrococcus brunensis TaxID=198483 RepID=A0A4R6BDR6_9STAP|nr:aminopeptidase P family protein [Macrococcus brunensis]TDL97875.1 aminopeptidase P family protein [Macrococcus brunensis]ULG71083.1 aminopeptidase P family protein [Macrococcus brunensis]ULG73419.1 aminopeptidase P family protein [Macrococcus brunensis]
MKFDKIQQLLADKKIEAVIILSPYNRRYLSLFTGSSGALVMTREENLLITDFRYISQATEQTDFTIIKQSGGLLDTIKTVLHDRNIKSAGFEGDLITFQQYQALSQQTELVDIAGEVEKIRMVKEPFEIEIIQQAADIADQAYEHIQTFIQAGKTELEVSNELEMFMRKQGASGSSFDTIVASGVRGALPHGVASSKVIEQGEMITLDYGAIYNGYISDITRTLSVGEPLEEMRQIYDIVLKAQVTALETIQSGMTGRDADQIARQIIADAGYGEAFGHSLGHGIGLEVHEGPGLSMASDVQLEPNMCVTLEPGIYVEGLGGVRIEDDVLVTESGLKRFTHSSKDLIIL